MTGKTLPDLALEIVEAAARTRYLDRLFRVRHNMAYRLAVQEIAERVLAPHTPPRLEPCLILPRYRESVRHYACRVVERAVFRAKAYGGLRGIRLSP